MWEGRPLGLLLAAGQRTEWRLLDATFTHVGVLAFPQVVEAIVTSRARATHNTRPFRSVKFHAVAACQAVAAHAAADDPHNLVQRGAQQLGEHLRVNKRVTQTGAGVALRYMIE